MMIQDGKSIDLVAQEIMYDLGITEEDNSDLVWELYEALWLDGFR